MYAVSILYNVYIQKYSQSLRTLLTSSISPHLPPSCTARICVVRLQTKQVLRRDYIFLSYFRAQVDADTQSNISPLPRRSCLSAAQMLKLWQGLGLYVRVLMFLGGDALMFSVLYVDTLARKINKIIQFHLNRCYYNCINLALRDRFKRLVINLSLYTHFASSCCMTYMASSCTVAKINILWATCSSAGKCSTGTLRLQCPADKEQNAIRSVAGLQRQDTWTVCTDVCVHFCM